MTEVETIERDEVRRLNANALSQVMQESGMTIPIGEFNLWRPTVVVTGEIQGITKATILATDGNIGVFRDELTGEFFKGHIGWFSGVVETLYGAPKKATIEVSCDLNTPEQIQELDKLLAKWGKVSHHTATVTGQRTQGVVRKVKQPKSQGLTKAFADLKSLGL